MNSYDFLKYLTVNLSSELVCKENSACTATGFYAIIKNKPVIVTAQHFTETTAETVTITGHYAEKDSVISFPVTAKVNWTCSEEYDIAYCEVKPFAENFKEITGKEMFYTAIQEKDIAAKEDLSKIGILNEIMTIGYPRGRSSTHHEFPLFKKGYISTLPKDFTEDRKAYLDLCVEEGFSGATLFLNNSQLKLIGILVGVIKDNDSKLKNTATYVTADKLIELTKENT